MPRAVPNYCTRQKKAGLGEVNCAVCDIGHRIQKQSYDFHQGAAFLAQNLLRTNPARSTSHK